MTKQELIERIKFIRKRAHLTQKELSQRLGMNISYINRLESKKDFAPSFEVLMQIIDECGSSVEEFFCDKSSKTSDYDICIHLSDIDTTASLGNISLNEVARQVAQLQVEALVQKLNNAFGEGFASFD